MRLANRSFSLLFLLCSFSAAQAQYEIRPAEGYTPQIGVMVSMLEDLKGRITNQIKNLNIEETDYLFDENANSIGALIMHLIATEAYYQVETLEDRKFTKEESEFWSAGSNLGKEGREKLKGKPIKYYLDLWDEIREKTLEGLKSKDDAWFATKLSPRMNYHWAWFHVMEHSANHMGQIALVKNRLKNK